MKKTVKKVIKVLFLAAVVCAAAQTSDTAPRPMRTADEGLSDEEFRRGVQSYYRGSFNDAVIRFEKALAYNPASMTIMDWLGKAYYRSGLEGAAIDMWQSAYDEGYGGSLLLNRIEVIRDRRITGVDQETSLKYTESGVFPGTNGNTMIFSQPVSVLPNPDGTVWMLAYGSNVLLLFDINGTVINRITGPINGFDRPVDVIRLNDGRMLVTESAGDRLSLFSEKGSFIKYIGKKGRGAGEMIGPQYAAQDSFGNIYVSDFGNCRVDVFDSEGNPLFYFGGRSDSFTGLQGPTGVAVYQDRIFVADGVTGGVYEFDRSGNYVGLLVEEHTFKYPEALKNWGSWLLTCDTNKVISIDADTGATFENSNIGNAPARITSAVPDVNGNLLVTDLVANEMYVMSKMTEVIGGLFVQIESVNAERFPDVTIELRVENRHRQPLVGLRDVNFFVSEGKRPVADLQLTGSAFANKSADVTLIIDRSVESARYREALETAVHELADSMAGQGTLRIISAGKVPVVEFSGDPAAARMFSAASLRNPVSDTVAVDLAVRLAVNELVRGEKKRAIVYMSAGTITDGAFTKYTLSDLSAYMNNNSVSFSLVQLAQRSAADEFDYLCTNTLGSSYFVYRPEGLSAVLKDIIAQPSGLYQLKYRSSLTTDWGTAYLPVEAEVYLLNRSGRDETGYFAPLQ